MLTQTDPPVTSRCRRQQVSGPATPLKLRSLRTAAFKPEQHDARTLLSAVWKKPEPWENPQELSGPKFPGRSQRLAAKMERERLLQHALPDLSRRIVEHAREHGRVTIKEMTLLTGISRNTLKEHFQRLLENGMLERNGQGRGVWYRIK